MAKRIRENRVDFNTTQPLSARQAGESEECWQSLYRQRPAQATLSDSSLKSPQPTVVELVVMRPLNIRGNSHGRVQPRGSPSSVFSDISATDAIERQAGIGHDSDGTFAFLQTLAPRSWGASKLPEENSRPHVIAP